MNYFALNLELYSDPLTRGYSSMSDQEAADDLNTVYRTRNITSMSSSDVLQSVDDTEYSALTDVKKNALWGLLGIAILNPWGKEADIMFDIFGSSNTITALQSARVENVSRADELDFGTVRASDVEKARAL